MSAPCSRANVLIFMTDQQSGRTLLPGSGRAITPRLDEFRRGATTFSDAYAPAPHCCPSRASFFTSVYPSQHGVWNNVNVASALSRGPREGTPFWSRDFAAAGYDLAFAGKWHVSNHEGPADFGWEELLVFPTTPGAGQSLDEQHRAARARDRARVLQVRENGPRQVGEVVRPGWPRYVHFGIDEDPFRDREVVGAARGFLARDHARPWVLYVGTLGPHDPYTVPQRFLDWYSSDEVRLPASFCDPLDGAPAMYRRARRPFDQLDEAEHRESLRHYLAFCSYEDDLFGSLLDAVTESGAGAETIVVYTSDHGDYMGEHGLWTKGLPSYSAAYHIPLVIGAPGQRDSRVADAPVSLVDLGPTLLELAGLPPSDRMAGESLAPVVRGEASSADRDIFFQSNGNEGYGMQRIVVHGRWKLVHNLFDEDELYDLEEDPDEMRNLLHLGAGRRIVGVEPGAEIPDSLGDIVTDLYRRLWHFALAHEDDVSNDYPLTAFASLGPGASARH